MLDVFVMIEGYCNLLIERVNLIQQEKECPDELKEATAGLIFAAARCGEFPELQELRAVFVCHFGREFVARAVELRNNCGVNPKIIKKLSTLQPDLETRMKVLREMASENCIILKLEETPSTAAEEKLNEVKAKQPEQDVPNNAGIKQPKLIDDSQSLPGGIDKDERFNSMAVRKKYKDVADAAQEAFQSAAYAAAAARAAVELSRSHPPRNDDHGSRSNQRKDSGQDEVRISGREKTDLKHEEIKEGVQAEDTNLSKNVDSKGYSSVVSPQVLQGTKLVEEEMTFDKSDDENRKRESNISSPITHGERLRGSGIGQPHKQMLPSLGTGIKVESKLKDTTHSAPRISDMKLQELNIGKRPIWVKTRR